MKRITCSPGAIFLSAIGMLLITFATASAQITKGEAGTPIGVWEIQISFRNCQTGDIIRQRPGLLSIIPGGVMQEFGTGTAPLDRTDAQGVWNHTTTRYFNSVSKAFRFAADGSLAGSVKLYREFELTDGGQGISVEAHSEIYDVNGILVATGCATETGSRLQ